MKEHEKLSGIFIESSEDECGRPCIQTNSKLLFFTDLADYRWKDMPRQAIYEEILRGNISVYTRGRYEYKNGEKVHTLYPYNDIKIGDFGIIECEDNAVVILQEVEEIEGQRYDEPVQRDNSENKKRELYRAINELINASHLTNAEKQDLKLELPEKQKTLGAHEAQPAAPAPVTNKTAAASAARQERALELWKAAIPAMLEVYHQCLAEGPTQRTKKDLERLFTRQGVELTQAQMAFFRDCLPEGHVNKTGGATLQKS